MSYTKPTKVEIREMQVPCPRCMAIVGEWCWDGHGYPNRDLHRERFDAATDAGALPIGDEVVVATDQPVTPDREALIRVAYNEMEARWPKDTKALVWDDAVAAVNALLPLLTDALDRARQQGEERGREKAAEAIEAGPILVLEEVITDELWRGARYAQHQAARLARGGPNRKDEEEPTAGASSDRRRTEER